ncbi:MAG: hypothetical protein GY869_19635, partial [Planctomycetes bacterium]|nr:hypothetical protein [Planctomycetota bacterium]
MMKKLLILLFTILICGSISNISQTGTTQTITAGDEIPPYVWHDPLLLQDMIQRGELTVEQLTTALETELPDPTRDNRILQTLHDLSTQQPDLLNPDRLAEIEEGYYGRMAGDFTRRPEVYADNDSDPGAKDIGDGAYDLKMSEPNITGDSNFGYCVAKAGDVNNDGFDDVIIGAYRYNRDTGRSYIYYGDVSMDNTADVTLDGEGIYNFFGYSVSGAGDVNNDGYDDVIVGAYGYNNLIGRSYIYYGGAAMDNTADVTLDGEGPGNHFGISVSGAGDVNNDGYDDVIVGAWRYNSDTGRSYIYYGGAAMDNTADVTLDGEGPG